MKKINVLNFEGLGDLSSAEYLIYSNDQLKCRSNIQSISSLELDYLCNSLKIIVVDQSNDLFISGLSINPNIFDQPGLQWLPLSLSDDDLIEELNELVLPPRVLVDIQMDLSPLEILITESSESGEEINCHSEQEGKEVDCQVVGLMVQVTELQNSLSLVRRNSEIEIEDIIFRFKEKVKKLRTKVLKLKEVVNFKESLIQEQKKDFAALKLSLEKSLSDKNDLTAKVIKLERLYESFYKHSAPIQTIYPTSPSDSSPKSSINSYSPLSTQNQPLSHSKISEISILPSYETQEIYNLSSKLAEFEKKLKKYSVLEEIESKVKKTLQLLKIEGIVKLADEAAYYLGNKKLNLFIFKDIIHVRLGGFIKTLESYIAGCCVEDINKFLKLRNSRESSVSKSKARSNNGFDSEKIQKSVLPKPTNPNPLPSPIHKSRPTLKSRCSLFTPLFHSPHSHRSPNLTPTHKKIQATNFS